MCRLRAQRSCAGPDGAGRSGAGLDGSAVDKRARIQLMSLLREKVPAPKLPNYPTKMADPSLLPALVEAGKAMAENMEKIHSKIVMPSVNALEKQINKIDTTIEGLHNEEKILVTQSKEILYNTCDDLRVIKGMLNGLADETIDVAKMLKRYVAKTADTKGMPVEKIKRIIGKAGDKMCQILATSKEILGQANIIYMKCGRGMNSIKAKLEGFVEGVESIKDGQDGRLQAWTDKTRAIVYGSLAVTAIFPPAMALAYATAAAALETKIAEYENALGRLLRKCKKSTAAAMDLIGQTDKTKDYIENEQTLLQGWNTAIQRMNYEFKSTDTIAEELHDFGRDRAFDKMLDTLITACTKYKAHAMIS